MKASREESIRVLDKIINLWVPALVFVGDFAELSETDDNI